MDCPAISPNMNPIKNVWGALSIDVYDGFRQFNYVDDIRDAILHAWEKIVLVFLHNLVKSKQNQYSEVIFKRGGPTHYWTWYI